jgi:bacteriocin-like protein
MTNIQATKVLSDAELDAVVGGYHAQGNAGAGN